MDVSEVQGKINWKIVPLRNIKFAMIRASYDLTGIDSEFDSNMKNISATEIFPGAYHQSSADSVADAVNEAKAFLKVVAPYKFYYPLALKYRNERATQIGKSFVTDIILAFLNTIKKSNYYVILYADVNWLQEHVNLNRIKDVDIWISDLSLEPKIYPSYDENVILWQYSNKGKVPGISGDTNLNISYVDYPSILEKRGLNNLNNNGEKTSFAIPMAKDECKPVFYTVAKGDTLRSIAQKTLGDQDEYGAIMELNGLTRPIIYPGQTLRIPNCNEKSMVLHRVKQGDTLWKISEKYLGYGPRYSEIMSANGLTTDMIYPGQILKIPINKPMGPTRYIVKQGDTLWGIAQNLLGDGNRYTEIMALNNLKSGSLRVGQSIVIPQK
ncbi:MAG: LysM peptidoglycan-binding domain-containing protein [Acutalibacteraceae bacterium]